MKDRIREERTPRSLSQGELIWAMGSLCTLHQRAFSPALMAREFPPPHTHASLIAAARSFGFRIRAVSFTPREIDRQTFPLLVSVAPRDPVEPEPGEDSGAVATTLGIVTAAVGGRVVLYRAGTDVPEILPIDIFESIFLGTAWLSAPIPEDANDPDAVESRFAASSFFGPDEPQQAPSAPRRVFDFGWFVPELLKHRGVWRDVLLASLCLQLIALVTPLCTQIIIDKVVVHRTQATLITIAAALLIFTVFSTALSWIRQYLVLHTGNRVDAVLGAAIWEHLLKLPLPYFQRRPTGVVAARLHGVETIREFISGAAVTLVLDLPFLIICLGVMLYYSVPLTALSVTVLALIAVVSILVAPVFQRRMNDQFLLGARNQAFVTEHIAGFETVKSLQMEPQLRQRYAGYLAAFLNSGFKTRQIGNTYAVFASTMEQAMTLGILLLGAWVVMTEKDFTIGRLVAFQMFAGKLSQPVMRLTGLWSQFQQARLSMQRLGDLLNAPAETYHLSPQRPLSGPGRIEIDRLAFRYAEDRPLLYENLSLTLDPGRSVAIMGPSGTGKSTLAKLLMGFYPASAGAIRIDGVDIRHMAVNELRSYFGVVPQETILFSGTIYDNLRAGNPAVGMEQVVQAARMAGIHAAIEALPEGYQTEVGERGAGLSGGQKQRLAIARALLKGPKVLVFDEATSALDGATADNFAKTINSLRGRVTMLFITHALPRSLQIDEVWQLGPEGVKQLKAVSPAAASAAAGQVGAGTTSVPSTKPPERKAAS